jgi:hypothetical protein
MKGFSLVWVLTWRARCSSFVKDFEHQEHKRSRLFRRRSLGILRVVSQGEDEKGIRGEASLGMWRCKPGFRQILPIALQENT